MATERPFVVRGLGLERRQVEVVLGQLVQAAVGQVGMAPDEVVEGLLLLVVVQGAVIPSVELGDLRSA